MGSSPIPDPVGSPRGCRQTAAAKFLEYLLETYRGVDQTDLVPLSRPPRRTIESALDRVRRRGLVEEPISLSDARCRAHRSL